MTEDDGRPYPGTDASSAQLLALADEYRRSAKALMKTVRKGEPLSSAPGRLCAIHAIELYLNAVLRHHGETAGDVRAYRHDLAIRAARPELNSLRLRKKTILHLSKLTEGREYLVARYGPEQMPTSAQQNRLKATLDELAGKVRKLIAQDTSFRSPASKKSATDVSSEEDASVAKAKEALPDGFARRPSCQHQTRIPNCYVHFPSKTAEG